MTAQDWWKNRGPITEHVRLVGDRIAVQRCLYDLSVNDLAQELGVHKKTVWDWERGRAFPRVDRQWQLAQTFGLEPDELFSWAKHLWEA